MDVSLTNRGLEKIHVFQPGIHGHITYNTKGRVGGGVEGV